MCEQTKHDNQSLVTFWDGFFALSQAEKEEARQVGVGPWEALAPAEKLLNAVCTLGRKQKVLDLGCGNGWAAIAAAKSGCPDVTAADPAPNAVDAAAFLTELFGVKEQVHPICCAGDWLKTVLTGAYDGFFCGNVLDVVPQETAAEIIREAARIVTPDAAVLIALNAYLTPEAAAEKGIELTADRTVYLEGVLRLVSRADAEWAALFAPYFTVESLTYFAWPGETEEKRRLFRLHKRQAD